MIVDKYSSHLLYPGDLQTKVKLKRSELLTLSAVKKNSTKNNNNNNSIDIYFKANS